VRARGPEAIGITAHATGYVWARNGLSHPELSTREGRMLFDSMRPTMMHSSALGGPTLESYLLARHRTIDALLERAIERDGVTQVIEVACGLSPRGWRFAGRYGSKLTYIEADLPGMANRKRRALRHMGSLGEHHRVETLDVLREDGPGSLATLAGELDPDAGLAIITEGLLDYLDRETVEGIWSRFARQLTRFRTGHYLADVQLSDEASTPVRAFFVMLSVLVRGRVDLNFTDSNDVTAALKRAGFERATMHDAEQGPATSERRGDAGARLAHVLQAK
jgi:O-methyltransferase involved in polyketide biosynthesis